MRRYTIGQGWSDFYHSCQDREALAKVGGKVAKQIEKAKSERAKRRWRILFMEITIQDIELMDKLKKRG